MSVRKTIQIGIIFFLITCSAKAQDWRWPDGGENLQVLDKAISSRDLSRTMRGFSRALGVRCSYCHAGVEGEPLSTFDFASDENTVKLTARDMMRMVKAINGTYLKEMEITEASVTCITCHNGKHSPRRLFDLVGERLETDGVDASVELLQSLRKRYYGGSAFDFSERSIIGYARGLDRAGNEAAAKAFYRLNLDYAPESGTANFWMGNFYAAHGDSVLARLYLGEALKYDPENEDARQRLGELE